MKRKLTIIIALFLILNCIGQEINYFQRGTIKFNQNDFIGAIEDYSKAIEIKPSDTLFVKRGESKFQIKDFESAIIDFTKAIEINPKNENAFIGRAHVKSFMKNSTEAINDYSEVIKINPNNPLAYIDRGYEKFLLFDSKTFDITTDHSFQAFSAICLIG